MPNLNFLRHRRGFLGGLVGAAAATLGLGRLLPTASAAEFPTGGGTDFERWLEGISGKHRQLYDAPVANHGLPLIWSHVFLLTGTQGYGVSESDLGVVVVLRHSAIPVAFGDAVWAKYRLGAYFDIADPATKAPATRNPFAHIQPGDMAFPEAALEKLVARGVKFAVCGAAIGFHSAHLAQRDGLSADAVKQNLLAAVLPGVTVVPSGVLAVNGAQSRGCTYCFAG
jgi:intracellular sulfur oxidation DsrE/DsrF family protein